MVGRMAGGGGIKDRKSDLEAAFAETSDAFVFK